MKKKFIILALISLLPQVAFSFETLTQTEKQQLAKGEMVKKVNWKDGYIWPEVTILTILNHTPQDNMNVFLDFDSHKSYIPDMLESRIVKKISPTEMHVYFEMEMPWPVKKTSHVTNNVISTNSDGSYTLTWNLMKAQMLKATDGSMTFYPYEGKTLLKYVSLIVPNSSFAAMFKDRVASDVEKSVQKIAKHLSKTLNKKESSFSTSQKITPQTSL